MPSASNSDCQRLKSVGDINLEAVKIKLVIGNRPAQQNGKHRRLNKKNVNEFGKPKKKRTDCYTNIDPHHGWCATYDMDNLTTEMSVNNYNEKNNASSTVYKLY